MFGFSVLKILFTIAVVIIVWQGFKWLNQRKEVILERAEKVTREDQQSQGQSQAEDMVQCPDCGAYVPKGSSHSCT